MSNIIYSDINHIKKFDTFIVYMFRSIILISMINELLQAWHWFS